MSRTFEGNFEDLLKATREWAEIGNLMTAKMQTKSCPGYSNSTASSRILDGNNNARPTNVYRKPSTKLPRTRAKMANLNSKLHGLRAMLPMSDEAKLRHALFAHIEQKTDEVWTSIDDLQKAMEAVPPADRSGPEWGGDGELSKRFIELMKRLGDIGHQFRLGLAAIEQSNVMGNKKN
jgi:hypothetical protein